MTQKTDICQQLLLAKPIKLTNSFKEGLMKNEWEHKLTMLGMEKGKSLYPLDIKKITREIYIQL